MRFSTDPRLFQRNPPAKKAKPASEPKKGDNNGEEKEWVLDRMRLVRINEYRGRRFVDIREHYERDGKVLPGKKGIALSGLQWRKLLEYGPEITKALEE